MRLTLFLLALRKFVHVLIAMNINLLKTIVQLRKQNKKFLQGKVYVGPVFPFRGKKKVTITKLLYQVFVLH